ncbi:MAG TPA: hypothetical protein VE631_08430 [Alphaproteobacteria bacterium]|nr:hypothetical protein [Alphaproteobacteria bacterium]
MPNFLLSWLVATALCVALVYGLRSWRLRRPGRRHDFHWRGTVVICLVAGLVAAFLANSLPLSQVPVPPGVAERPSIPD